MLFIILWLLSTSFTPHMFITLNTLNWHTINKRVEIYFYVIFTDISGLDCRVPKGKNDLLVTVKDVKESSYNPTSDTKQNKHRHIE